MEKYIEEIIEIVLDNVSCNHPQVDEYTAGGSMGHVEYSLINEQEVIKKCLAVIPEANIDNKFIEEKTFEMITIVSKGKILDSMSFIRSLINEVLEKIKFNGGKNEEENQARR